MALRLRELGDLPSLVSREPRQTSSLNLSSKKQSPMSGFTMAKLRPGKKYKPHQGVWCARLGMGRGPARVCGVLGWEGVGARPGCVAC